ncbi:PPE domain-containing protein [Actinophytocola sp.]|uniref:PPE domain-containing protein n=1 Tax=Actinophytocola sp. TaxID=1872138 RepID=UPI003D6B2163
MDGDHGLNDLRFDGYSNEELATQVNGLRDGSGASTLHNAVGALVGLAEGLAETDRTLREQLREIGVTWQGEAAREGTGATENATIYADEATSPVRDSAKEVDSQGAVFANTRNSAPESGVLLGPTEESLGDKVAGFLGHTTDHARDVRATNAARDQAIDGLNGYQQTSASALASSQALPVPPGMNLIAQPVEQRIGATGVPGIGPGGGPGLAGGGPGAGASPLPIGGGGGLPPGGGFANPGPTAGIGPISQAGQVPTAPGVGGLRAPIGPLAMAEAAAVMGAGGAGGAGAGAQGERATRGGGAGAKAPLKGGTPIGAAPDDEARAARNAERFGARTGRPATSIMQPAAAGHRGEGEDDKEHVRRYGIDSDDVFEDDRVVAPESIGDEDDRP